MKKITDIKQSFESKNERHISFGVCVVLICAVISLLLTGCGSAEKSVVGTWYTDADERLDIWEDGAWNVEYETGKWRLLEDKKTFEFVSSDGYVQKSEILKNDLGTYLDLEDFGKVYKDAYPSKEKIEEYKLKNAITIDPFEGLEYVVSGISPFCEIGANTQNCSDVVQKYVNYSFDKEYYANGETAKIYAELDTYTGDEAYLLSSSESEYTVNGQSEYVKSFEHIDMDYLKSEVSDKVTALISSSINDYSICDIYMADILDCGEPMSIFSYEYITDVTPELKTIYLSTIKEQKVADSKDDIVNKCSFIYCFDVSGLVEESIYSGKIYVNISANNIVNMKNGEMIWDNENYDFEVEAVNDGLDNCVTTTVMCNKDNYNIVEYTE